MKDQTEDLFLSLVHMLATGAMVHLGKIPDPETNAPRIDLQAARQSIELLRALREKTQGNLVQQEEAFLESTLTNLQLTFVQESERGEAEGAETRRAEAPRPDGEPESPSSEGAEQRTAEDQESPAADSEEKIRYRKTYD